MKKAYELSTLTGWTYFFKCNTLMLELDRSIREILYGPTSTNMIVLIKEQTYSTVFWNQRK